jgi:hypothetical protein
MKHRHLCRVKNMLAMYLKYQVHSEHIFDSTQAPVAVAVHEIGLHKQIK